MRLKLGLLLTAATLGGCQSTNIGAPTRVAGPSLASRTANPVELTLIALNDFHGNLEPPRRAVTLPEDASGPETRVPAGGAAYLAAAIQAIRARSTNHLTVSAGDLVSASPLTSSLFLDEPTVLAMNMIGLDYNAVGNHEFDRGRNELLRLDRGGCEKNTLREPCAVDPSFPGADFAFLAANVATETGSTLLPPYGMRSFGSGERRVDVGVIGMTLKGTPALVAPSGIAGLDFRDEAATVNALVPRLKAEGADVIVVLIHQGLETRGSYNQKGCGGLSGDLLPILQNLSSEVDVVVSGHTHQAYICDFAEVDASRPFLVTSGGSYGTLVTEIRLAVDPRSGEVVRRSADNHIVQSVAFSGSAGAVEPSTRVPAFTPDANVVALVERYRAAAAPLANRVVGSMQGSALRESAPSGENVLGNLIADAQLAATRGNGAQISFMNAGGVRADLVPGADGSITFGQIYAVQPFGNTLGTRTFSGRQLKAILEQQWASGSNTVEQPNVLLVSRGFTYSYDLRRPAGERVSDLRLGGVPITDEGTYRVTFSNFLASGGDNFSGFAAGTEPAGGALDLDALEAYLAANPGLAPPQTDRIRRLDPAK